MPHPDFSIHNIKFYKQPYPVPVLLISKGFECFKIFFSVFRASGFLDLNDKKILGLTTFMNDNFRKTGFSFQVIRANIDPFKPQRFYMIAASVIFAIYAPIMKLLLQLLHKFVCERYFARVSVE